jgi:preprotein translocase subunit YajC
MNSDWRNFEGLKAKKSRPKYSLWALLILVVIMAIAFWLIFKSGQARIKQLQDQEIRQGSRQEIIYVTKPA